MMILEFNFEGGMDLGVFVINKNSSVTVYFLCLVSRQNNVFVTIVRPKMESTKISPNSLC